MVSTKYLLEVAEFSCLKSMFVDRVISVKGTPDRLWPRSHRRKAQRTRPSGAHLNTSSWHDYRILWLLTIPSLSCRTKGDWHASSESSPSSQQVTDRKSTRLNSSHRCISYAVFC